MDENRNSKPGCSVTRHPVPQTLSGSQHFPRSPMLWSGTDEGASGSSVACGPCPNPEETGKRDSAWLWW